MPFSDALATMIGAAADRQAVSFRYRDADRVVEPWRLSFSRGHWYLNGWDRLRERTTGSTESTESRADVAVVGPAEHPVGAVIESLDLRGWELGDGEPITASVRVDADQAAYARHMLDDLDELDDGGVLARLEVRNFDGFCSFVVSFLEHAEVIDPPELRDEFIAWLRRDDEQTQRPRSAGPSLSVIPWVAEQPDGAAIDDIVERFAYPRKQLLADLQEVVFFVGVHPFTPDSLIEVEVSDDRVSIRYAEWFSRPLRLSPEEGARLLTAARSVLPLTESAGDDPDASAPSPLAGTHKARHEPRRWRSPGGGGPVGPDRRRHAPTGAAGARDRPTDRPRVLLVWPG